MTEPTAFRTVLRGYEPTQVDHTVAELMTSVEAARSEAAARTVEVSKLQAALAALQKTAAEHAAKVAALEESQRTTAPPSYADLGDRIGSILTLADEEAAALRASAAAAAAEHREQATKEALATRATVDRYADEVRSKATAEATKIVENARRTADTILDDADREASARRGEAEAVYESQRARAAQAAADFETTLAARRDKSSAEFSTLMEQHESTLAAAQDRAATLAAEAERAHQGATASASTLLDQAHAEATSLVSAARDQAERIRRDSERELAAVSARRDSITAQLTNVRQMLATLGGASFVDPLAGHGAPENDAAESVAAADATGPTEHVDEPPTAGHEEPVAGASVAEATGSEDVEDPEQDETTATVTLAKTR
jgi:cell division septum initiation protein DivIVA